MEEDILVAGDRVCLAWNQVGSALRDGFGVDGKASADERRKKRE